MKTYTLTIQTPEATSVVKTQAATARGAIQNVNALLREEGTRLTKIKNH